MSKVRADNFTDRSGNGSPNFPFGLRSAGIVTATAFSGNLTGNVSGTAGGLSGTPNITVGSITGTTGSFSGNVDIAGVLTYEDVTNIDSVGIVTARAGFVADGFKIEEGNNDGSTNLNGVVNIDFDSGQIHRFSSATAGNYYPNFRLNSSNSPTLGSKMDVGDVTSATLIIASSSHYIASPSSIQIDGSSSNIDVDWVGGSAPSAANGSGFDIYAFTIIKTASTPAYHVIGNIGACA